MLQIPRNTAIQIWELSLGVDTDIAIAASSPKPNGLDSIVIRGKQTTPSKMMPLAAKEATGNITSHHFGRYRRQNSGRRTIVSIVTPAVRTATKHCTNFPITLRWLSPCGSCWNKIIMITVPKSPSIPIVSIFIASNRFGATNASTPIKTIINRKHIMSSA